MFCCESCEQQCADNAAKVFKGKRVCPSCFQALVVTGMPGASASVQVIQTHHVRTTVCPTCNAEIHADSRSCPKCGSPVRFFGRLFRALNSIYSVLFGGGLFLVGCLFLLVALGQTFRWATSQALGEADKAGIIAGAIIGPLFIFVGYLVWPKRQ